jgi:hypothetical protein
MGEVGDVEFSTNENMLTITVAANPRAKVVLNFVGVENYTCEEYKAFEKATLNELAFGTTSVSRIGPDIKFRDNDFTLTIADCDCGELYTQLVEARK